MAQKTVNMPRLSDSMEEGKVLRWAKKPGETVARGELIAEIETDKATLELESPFAGVVKEIVASVGASVPIGEPLAIIDDGAQVGDQPPPKKDEPAVDPDPPAMETSAEDAPPEPEPSPPPKPEAPRTTVPQEAPAQGRVKASPLARREAAKHGIDLHQVKGTGPKGRVMLGDVEGYMEATGQRSQPPGGVDMPLPEVHAGELGTTFPLSSMRRAIATTTTQAMQETPHFYARVVIDTAEAERIKATLNEHHSGLKVSWTALLVRATALALKNVPRLNATYSEVEGQPSMEVYDQVNIGIAVAVDEGIVVPVLHDVVNQDIPEIARTLADLAQRTRAGELKSSELTQATFSISNLGMAGIEEFTAIIPRGQSGILAIGSIQDEVCVRDGQVGVVRRMRVTLSSDHRIVDGWGAAQFLNELKRLLENPALLLL